MSTNKGISLHIGVNRLDPAGYPLTQRKPEDPAAWEGPLTACERDAEDMCKIAESQGFEPTILKTADATSENVIAAIRDAAARLRKGDIFLMTYAGHGGQVPDSSGDERDMIDETWCLHDRQFLDDEQFALYTEFEEGVRVLILSDSCHSGTVTRAAPGIADSVATEGRPVSRNMPRDTAFAIYDANASFYDELQRNVKKVKADDVKVSIRLISACQDDQEASDGVFNGKFTGTVKKVWDNGAFQGSYVEFHQAIRDAIVADYDSAVQSRAAGEISWDPIPQTPKTTAEGQPDVDFDSQKPFSI